MNQIVYFDESLYSEEKEAIVYEMFGIKSTIPSGGVTQATVIDRVVYWRDNDNELFCASERIVMNKTRLAKEIGVSRPILDKYLEIIGGGSESSVE